jgi:hypothetical protein
MRWNLPALPGSGADLWTLGARSATIRKHPDDPARSREEVAVMIAVIGNVLAGIGVVGLFTATLRLTKRIK